MAAIERTAYPTWPAGGYHLNDIHAIYTPTKEEIQWVERSLRHSPGSKNQKKLSSQYQQHCLNVLVLLKCYQHLHYFPKLRTVPKEIIAHIQKQLNLPEDMHAHYQHTQILYRHHALIRDRLHVKLYAEGGKEIAEKIATDSAKIHNYPSDIINQVLEALIKKKFRAFKSEVRQTPLPTLRNAAEKLQQAFYIPNISSAYY